MLTFSKSVTYRGGYDLSISFIRLVAMCFIFICHILQFYGNQLAFVFNVGVQIFLFISGYLYGIKYYNSAFFESIQFIKKNTWKILKAYWVFLIISFVLYLIFFPQYLDYSQIVDYAVCSQTIKGLGHLWFIPYIIFCYCITPCLRYYCDSNNHIILKTAYFIIVFIVLSYCFDSFFNPIWILCYILGFYISTKTKGKLTSKYLKSVIIIFFALTLLFNCIVPARRIYNITIDKGLVQIIFDMGHTCAGVLMFAAMYLFCQTIISFKSLIILKILAFSDKYSYGIYIVHGLFILSPFSVLQFNLPSCINILIAIVLSLLCAVGLKRSVLCLEKHFKNTYSEIVNRFV